MRYVVFSNIKKGMILGLPLYGENSELLYDRGTKLKNAHIKAINKLGFSGIYIEDELSSGIEIDPIVPDSLRMKTVKAAKKLIKQAEADAEAGTMRHVSVDEQRDIVMPVIEMLLSKDHQPIFDYFDIKPYGDYDYYHAANVMIISLMLGIKLGVDEEKLFDLGISSLIHDVGNVFIPKDILNKPGELTPDEFEIVKSHAEKGFDYLSQYYDLSTEACKGALQHHENFDGTGYPGNLRRHKISQFGRIIALTDVYDALISRRPFRNALYPYQALDIVRQRADRKFDPEIVHTLEKIIAPYPVTAAVELNTPEVVGIVKEVFPDDISRPTIMLPMKRRGDDMLIDLHSDMTYKNSTIIGIVEEK